MDRERFEREWRRCYPRLEALARRFTNGREEAQDLLMETACKSLQNIEKCDKDRPLYPWLCKVMQRISMDTVRRNKRRPVLFEDLDAGLNVAAAEDSPYTALCAKMIRAELDPIMELRTQDFDHADISEALKIGSPTAARHKCFHSRARARERLKELEWVENK